LRDHCAPASVIPSCMALAIVHAIAELVTDMSTNAVPKHITQGRLPGLWTALGLIAMYFLLQMVIGSVIGIIIGFATGIARHGGSAAGINAQLQTVMTQPDTHSLLAIITLPLAALIILYVARQYWPTLWALRQPPGLGMAHPTSPVFYGIAVGVGLLMPMLGGYITQVLAHGQEVSQNVVQMGRGTSGDLRIPLLLIVISIGPLVEELLFRGVLLSALMQRLRLGVAVAVCVVLFAAVHLPGLDFKWYALPDLMLLAAALCWLRLKSGSLWPAVLAHGVNNLFAMTAVFIAAAQQHV